MRHLMYTMCLAAAITATACDDGSSDRDDDFDAGNDMQSDDGTTTDAMVDETAPETSLLSTPDDPTNDGSATFEFEADEPASFRCRVDADAFAAQVTGTSTTSATSGVVTRTSIALTNAQADAIAAGDAFRLRVQRVATDAGDTMVGDAQALRVGISQ